MTTQSKLTTSYVFGGLAFAASIGGIFYASKKGYGGWGKFGMFLLFAAPFSIASGAFRISAQMDAVVEDNMIKEKKEQELAAAAKIRSGYYGADYYE
jgi:hypothetical protein